MLPDTTGSRKLKMAADELDVPLDTGPRKCGHRRWNFFAIQFESSAMVGGNFYPPPG